MLEHGLRHRRRAGGGKGGAAGCGSASSEPPVPGRRREGAAEMEGLDSGGRLDPDLHYMKTGHR